jgi:hypothetical protein
MLLERRFASGKHLNQSLTRRLIKRRMPFTQGKTRENNHGADCQPESGMEHLFLQ